MGYHEGNYLAAGEAVHFTNLTETYQQDIVLVLRYPGSGAAQMRPGAPLSPWSITRRAHRIEHLRELGPSGLARSD
jgi:hypothetical protein